MNPVADILLEQISYSQALGKQILLLSGINADGVIYAFATPETLVINCKDDRTTWQFDEEQCQLQRAIVRLKSSIQTIWIEKAGKLLYYW